MPSNLKEASDRICQVKPSEYGGKDFRGNHITRHVFFKENVDQETVVRQLDEFLDEVYRFERDIREGLGMKEG